MSPLSCTGRIVTSFENGGTVVQILLACIRELEAFGLPDEQFNLQRILEPAEMMAESGFGDVVGDRGARQAAGAGNLPESPDVFQLVSVRHGLSKILNDRFKNRVYLGSIAISRLSFKNSKLARGR
jgi:hypothetical protein